MTTRSSSPFPASLPSPRTRGPLFVVAALFALIALATPASALDGRRIRVRDGRLFDEYRREITLRGVNARVPVVFDVTFDDGRLPIEDIPQFDPADCQRMRDLGFNLLRLPISWSGLEPQPGAYSTTYLDAVQGTVDACWASGILTLIDFHQDAFSKEIGQDGAPRWVLDRILGVGNYPYLGGPVDAAELQTRRFAPYGIAAWQKWFANEQNIWDDFAAAAQVVAKRFRRHPGVLGYEIMNEPLAAVAANGQVQLEALHTKIARAIRKVDHRHLVVFEPDTIRNILNTAPLPPAPFPVRGTMYAPHIYTGVFDATDFTTGNVALLEPSMQHAAQEAAAWGSALLIGEYGIDPNHPFADLWIRAQLDLQDRYRASSTFWLWEEISSGQWGLWTGESGSSGSERAARQYAISRTFARAVPGDVLEHDFDADTNTLRLTYRVRNGAEVEIFLPEARYPTGFSAFCNGAIVDAPRDPATGTVSFPCGILRADTVVEIVPLP